MPLRFYSGLGSRKRISRKNMVFQITDGLFQSGTQLLEPRDCGQFDFTVNLAHVDGPCNADIHWGIDDGPLPDTNDLMNSLKLWLSVYIVVTLYLFFALLVLTVPV